MYLLVCKRKLGIIYRKAVRQFFRIYISLSDKKYIVAKIEHPSLANYFYGVIGIAWLCEKMHINLEFVFPKENPPFFENCFLYRGYPNKISTRKDFFINDSNDRLASIARKAARKDLPAEYGHKIISQLLIRQDIRDTADEWFGSHIKGNWVAVHYRGTDAHTHPRSDKRRLSIDSYIAWLKEVIDNQCDIFACSDQAQFIDKMQSAFPNRVHYREIRRSIDSKPIHSPNDDQYGNDGVYRQRHDALIDILILAKASLIYTTGSWFVNGVKNFNPRIKIISLDRRVERRNTENYLPIPKESLLRTLQNGNR